jgi:hypothetical protein
VNVLLTIALIAAVAMWAITAYGRLVRLRNGVKEAWRTLEADQANAATRRVYNDRVDRYNEFIAAFPTNAIAGAAGFQPAKRFE